jgi:ubiquinone/menaquinone biosynthesis C-methylase UbiE
VKPFTERSTEQEIMDIRELTPEETASVYTWIGRVNRFLGGTRVILKHLENFSKNWPEGQTIRILDVGTGSSDIPAEIIKWAARKKLCVHVTALDIDHRALVFGKSRNADIRSLSWVQASCEALPFPDKSFDYVLSSMFFHHLSPAMILKCLEAYDRLAKRGIIINDLYRSRLAYALFDLGTLAVPSPVFRHDGLLSIRRSFRKNDLKEMIQDSGLQYLAARRHFAFRVSLAGEK